MKVVVDIARCDSDGACAALAPDVFRMADDGVVLLLDERPGAEQVPCVEAAVRACPAHAIRLESA